MQTDRGIYHKRVCDRCGAVLSGRMMNPDEYFKDWAWRRDTGDLCPECYAEYKRVIGRFNREREGREDEEVRSLQVQTVLFDHGGRKRCQNR